MSIKIKLFIATLVILLVSMNILVEELTVLNISGAEILTLRSLFSLFLIFSYSLFARKSIIPKEPKLQISSFFFSGLSLLLIMTGFEYISAGSVSTIQRMDIPLLIFIAALNSKITRTQLILSLLTFVIIILLVLFSDKTNENPTGYFILFAGVVCICINALLQKKISQKEEVQIIIAVTSLSSLVWSLLRCYQKDFAFTNVGLGQLAITALLGVFNIGIIFLVTQLYKVYSPDFVRYPFLVCTFLTMIAEMVVEHKIFSPLLLTGNIVLLIIVTYLVKSRLDSKNLTMRDEERTANIGIAASGAGR